MNHRPFEDWLLDEQSLTPEQKRALDAHLRTCTYCTALAESGMQLRHAQLVPPKPGFAGRFERRLAAHHLAEQRRRRLGSIVFVTGGLGVLAWLAAPHLGSMISSPAEWLTIGIGYLVFLVTTVQALTEVILVLFRVAPGFVPPYGWMVIASTLAGLGLLWSVSIWRFTRFAQGA